MKKWTLTTEQKEELSRKRKEFWNTEKGKEVRKKISMTVSKLHVEGVLSSPKLSTQERSKIMGEVWKRPGHSDKVRETRVANHGGWSPSEEVKKKISDSLKGRAQPPRTAEHCSNLSKSVNKPETLKKLAEIGAKSRTKQASPNTKEKLLEAVLNKNFPGEFKLNVKNGLIIGNKVPDFVNVNGRKVLVELFGDYWHSTRITGKSKEAEEATRKSHFNSWGFKTVIIWESELHNTDLICNKISEIYREIDSESLSNS